MEHMFWSPISRGAGWEAVAVSFLGRITLGRARACRSFREASGLQLPSNPTGASRSPFWMLQTIAARCFRASGCLLSCTAWSPARTWFSSICRLSAGPPPGPPGAAAPSCATDKTTTAWLSRRSTLPATGIDMRPDAMTRGYEISTSQERSSDRGTRTLFVGEFLSTHVYTDLKSELKSELKPQSLPPKIQDPRFPEIFSWMQAGNLGCTQDPRSKISRKLFLEILEILG